ncbi:MAG: phosphatase PAP2 family protein [Lysobacteraceae bacterium]
MKAVAAGDPRRRAAIAVTVALAAFALCAIAMRTGLAHGFDEAVLQALHVRASPALETFARWLAVVGYRGGVLPFDALLVLVLASRKRWRSAGFAAVALGGGLLLNRALKLLFARPRPMLDWSATSDLPASLSFPSGHAMATATLATVLTALAWRSRWRWPVALAAWAFALLVAASRVLLGVHFPSDVVAGAAVGIAWACGAWWLVADRRGAASG